MRPTIPKMTSLAILSMFLSLAGCQGAREKVGTLGALQAVQRHVATTIKHDQVTVNLNNDRYLTVGIVNSSMKALPDDQKEAKAREIAMLAYGAFPARASLESVAVVFVVNRSYLFIFNMTDATDYHGFPARELAGAEPKAEPTGR